MNNLFEEYNRYVEFSTLKEKLNILLLELSGRNDEESLSKINDISAKLNQINTTLKTYDLTKLDSVKKYLDTKKEFERICDELRTIEKLSKKTNGEKVIIESAEGRKKSIDKELAYEYQLLSEKKKKMRPNFEKEYRNLAKIDTLVTVNEEAKKVSETEIKYVLPKLPNYEDLPLSEKIKETEKRLKRIVDSSSLPNQGKKVIKRYNGHSMTIPKKYEGYFIETVKELSALKKKEEQERNRQTVSSLPSTLDNKTIESVPSVKAASLPSSIVPSPIVNNQLSEKIPYTIKEIPSLPIKIEPIKINPSTKVELPLNREYVGNVDYLTVSMLKSYFDPFINIDKKVELGYLNLQKLGLDLGIKIKNRGLQIAENAIFKYNSAKSFVTSVSHKVIKFISDQKEIYTKKKDLGLLRAMEEVYASSKEEHLDYRIVNRTVNFKENTCQRISNTWGSISRLPKTVLARIKMPFTLLRESTQNEVEREMLIQKIEETKEMIAKRKETLTRVKVKENSGYIVTGILAVVGTILLAGIIFTIIGNVIIK